MRAQLLPRCPTSTHSTHRRTQYSIMSGGRLTEVVPHSRPNTALTPLHIQTIPQRAQPQSTRILPGREACFQKVQRLEQGRVERHDSEEDGSYEAEEGAGRGGPRSKAHLYFRLEEKLCCNKCAVFLQSTVDRCIDCASLVSALRGGLRGGAVAGNAGHNDVVLRRCTRYSRRMSASTVGSACGAGSWVAPFAGRVSGSFYLFIVSPPPLAMIV